jgi:hypothetical protein
MSKYRKKMSKRHSAKKFKTGMRTKKINLQGAPSRGGIRL